MKIQENLAWDKNSRKVIGYVDLADIKLNFSILPNVNKIASHIMVFLVCSIVNIQISKISPLLWKALGIFELNSLKGIACTCDGASLNHELLKCIFT